MRYTYGTNETALRRLKTVSEVFDHQSSAFIRKQIPVSPKCSIDLGCGPGFSTLMLAGAARAMRTCGLDNSEEFLGAARAACSSCDFFHHDVTKAPFPVMADLMYCRFLLSHLRSPASLVDLWLGELAPGGLLLMEEVEDIDTGIEVFQRYLEVNQGLVASQNARLYIGGVLAGSEYTYPPMVNEIVSLPIDNAHAASMFYPNTISIWEKEKYVLDSLTREERREISEGLRNLAESGGGQTAITWKMRRIAILKAC
jgi:trans-aconitate 2-methyltransferase